MTTEEIFGWLSSQGVLEAEMYKMEYPSPGVSVQFVEGDGLRWGIFTHERYPLVEVWVLSPLKGEID